jgi:hypothetical protein
VAAEVTIDSLRWKAPTPNTNTHPEQPTRHRSCTFPLAAWKRPKLIGQLKSNERWESAIGPGDGNGDFSLTSLFDRRGASSWQTGIDAEAAPPVDGGLGREATKMTTGG